MELVVLIFAISICLISSQNYPTVKDIPSLPEDGILLKSEDFSYPAERVDVVWKFFQDAEVIVEKFQVDGQVGDFLLVSKYPSPLDAGSTTIPKIVDSTQHGITQLLSWNIITNLTYHIVNPDGFSIYFHGSKHIPGRDPPTGFRILVKPFESNIEDVTTTTEPPITTPPGQDQNDFLTKFITGRYPYEFVLEVEEGKFQQTLVEMTDAYLADAGIQRPNQTEIEDVDVPIEDIRFCDRSWPPYEKCVEVTFAIVTYDIGGSYVMKSNRMSQMWDNYQSILNRAGLFNYEPPTEHLPGTVYIIVTLSSVLLASILLAIAWSIKSKARRDKEAELSKAVMETTDEEKFYDRENPIYQIRKTVADAGEMFEPFHYYAESNTIRTSSSHHDADLERSQPTSIHFFQDEDDDELDEYVRDPRELTETDNQFQIARPQLHRQRQISDIAEWDSEDETDSDH